MITVFEITENTKPFYLKTRAVQFCFNDKPDKKFTWELLDSHDTVHIIVDNVETKEILLVKQRRIPVLLKDKTQDGFCIEACAGLIDKEGKSPLIIAQEEIEEELGYYVDEYRIKLVKQAKSGLGSSGNDIYYYSAEVTEKDKVSNGGGTENESIEVYRLKYEDIPSFIDSDFHTDSTTLFLLTNWLLQNTLKKLKK